MDLFKYFKWEGNRDCLPDPHGPLNKQFPLSSIEEANKEVADNCYKETSKEKKHWFSLQFCNARAESQGGEICDGKWH